MITFKLVIKHAMGVVAAILAMWGAGFLYTAATSPYAVWWDQGTMGVLCWIVAAVIYRRCSDDRRCHIQKSPLPDDGPRWPGEVARRKAAAEGGGVPAPSTMHRQPPRLTGRDRGPYEEKTKGRAV